MTKDNRKHVRVDSRLRCWCEGENVTFYARVGNLSEGGLFLRTSTPLHEGAVTTLRFGAKAEEQIEARATVVWCRAVADEGPPGMGLQFVGVDDRKLEAIRRIIRGEQKTRKD